MKMKRILINFWRFTAIALVLLGRSVVTKMTGNSNFTTPDPSLADVTSAIDDTEKKAALAKDGGKAAKSNLKTSRKSLINIFRDLAWYVEKTANGDENILISSGFTLSKEPVASQRDQFFVLAGIDPGTVTIGCVAYKKAGAYLWFCFAGAELPPDIKAWVLSGASTQRKTLLTGLTPGQYYWFRYRAVTPAGMMEWSDPIRFYVQ